MWLRISVGGGLAALLVLAFFSGETPRLDRDWSLDQAIPATVTFSGDMVTIQNVRNFTYRSTTDYTPGYYDTTVNLNDLERVEYIVEPFGDIGAAHTFLTFGFRNGQQIAISVEIRKEKGETFSAFQGLLDAYELMYVIADERDVINLRANHRRHDVYLYPTTADREQARALFVQMLTRAMKLTEEPEFYNTFFNNCTTNIAAHINDLSPGRVPFDPRLILPEHSDALAQELGFIAQEISLAEARARYRVNDRAATAPLDETFSRVIRDTARSQTETDQVGEVVTVIDGDTIEVRIAGVTERVRYIGIDTPELNLEGPSPECFAVEAAARNRALVGEQWVNLKADTTDKDPYGRLLRYVFVNGSDVGATLLSEGYGKSLAIPPNTDQAVWYEKMELVAKEERRGIWGEYCAG